MDNNLDAMCSNHIIVHRTELFGITCLAVIGVMCIISNIAGSAYRLGRETKEHEMKRDFKKYMKKLKKEKRGL